MPPKLSLLVLTRNEEGAVAENLRAIWNHARSHIESFEIIVSDYSEDATPGIVGKLALPDVRLVRAPRRGIGAGLKAGLADVRGDVVLFYPIDLSWKLTTIERSLAALEGGAGVVIGSRWCPGAHTRRPFIRNVFSKGYNALVRVAFGLRIADTQGTFAMRRVDLERFRERLESDDPFLQTEILIHARELDLSILEIPCDVSETRNHSNVAPLREARSMLGRVIWFWWTHSSR